MAEQIAVVGGIDTHTDFHQAAVIDAIGRHLATEAFPTTPDGYRRLLDWLCSHGEIMAVGVEGTGAYGSELARFRRSAVKSRTQTINQIRTLIVTAPGEVREKLRGLATADLIRHLARSRPGTDIASPACAARTALRRLSRRYQYLTEEIAEADAELKPLVATAAPTLVELPGLGTETAAQLLITAGDNPDRLKSEGAFAHLCAAAPIPASSGRTNRHRLNRGGDRQANNALHMIALVRMRYDQRTRDYVARRTAEGMSKKDILRCLKRFIAREVYKHLTSPSTTPKSLLQTA
ncbi:IS110 family transposase [Streptomyces sp. NPDC060064]|uniref:IS110 family transposase n=1 Tax=Streptomyces sp. NPDC060064 TaxID=3347049 RepID=UPI0036C7DDC2